jgi:RNA recognition motif-containing protein
MLQKKRTAELIFAANLPFTFTNDQLGSLFDPFGVVIASRLVFDSETGQSRGFGFVELATERAMDAAITALNGKKIDGREIEVKRANQPVPSVKHSKRPAAAKFAPAAAAAPQRPVIVEYRNRFASVGKYR